MRALALALALPALAQTPPDAAARVFVELRTQKDTYYEGEPIALRLRLGCDTAFFAAQALQPFQQRLDVPVQLLVPWLDAPPGTTPLPNAAPSTPQRRIACNDGTAMASLAADAEFDGRRFTVLELQRRFVARSQGELQLPAPRLHFAFATRFEDNLLQQHAPLDRQDVTVEGRALLLRILPLPPEGRPRGFTGAVGDFAITATASPLTLPVAGELQLVLTLRGDGNLALLPPPQPNLPGFHVYGRSEQPADDGRRFLFQLAPLRAELRQVPAIPFAFFDPTSATYRTVATAPIPITVEPLPPGAEVAPLLAAEIARARPGDNDIHELMPVPAPPTSPSSLLVFAALLLPWLLFAPLYWRRQRLFAEQRDPLSARSRRAHAEFAAAMARGDELAPALTAYLAARLRCSEAAVLDQDLPRRLQQLHLSPALASSTARQLEALVQSRYGGAASASQRPAVIELVAQIEAAGDRR